MRASRRIWLSISMALGIATFASHGFAQSQKQMGERLIQQQEQRAKVNCKSLHPAAHRFVAEHVRPLASGPKVGGSAIAEEALSLAEQTHACYGIEPIARHTGVPFESDFGELSEVLRQAHRYLVNKDAAMADFELKQLQKRLDELRTGTGRRYPVRT